MHHTPYTIHHELNGIPCRKGGDLVGHRLRISGEEDELLRNEKEISAALRRQVTETQAEVARMHEQINQMQTQIKKAAAGGAAVLAAEAATPPPEEAIVISSGGNSAVKGDGEGGGVSSSDDDDEDDEGGDQVREKDCEDMRLCVGFEEFRSTSDKR